MNPDVELILIAGTAGAGKSTALKALEDVGVSCVDNLPIPLLPHFLDFLKRSPQKSDRYALILNCYTREAVVEVRSAIDQLKKDNVKIFLLFLDARDEILVQRFRETRRPHPIRHFHSEVKQLREAAQTEREILAPVRSIADRTIDTSSDSPHDLRRKIQDLLSFQPEVDLSLVSFGFKYGIPFDSDMVFDVRFLANPYFVKELREKNGRDKEIQDFVLGNEDAQETLRRLNELIEFLLPRFQKEGKRYLTISIGCTGGKHRSVTLVEAIGAFLKNKGIPANIRHRDVDRG